MVATCTDGSRGDIQNPGMVDAPHPKRDMAGARRLEMANAAAVLGIRQRWLGFVDSGLPEGDPLPPLPPGCFALQPLERATAPLARSQVTIEVLTNPVWCRPCMLRECPIDHRCMTGIEPGHVLAAIDRIARALA